MTKVDVLGGDGELHEFSNVAHAVCGENGDVKVKTPKGEFVCPDGTIVAVVHREGDIVINYHDK